MLGGPVEVLVANAGITRDTLLMRMSDDDFDAVIDTNLAGRLPLRPARGEGHDRSGAGRIIFISSVVGLWARRARPTTRPASPAWSAWPARSPASSAAAGSPPTSSRPASSRPT